MSLKKERLSREDTLKAKPVKNEVVKERKEEKGETVLVIPRKKVRWVGVLSRIFYIPPEKKISLDEIGVWVWSRCNGNVSVINMIEELSRQFKINRKEAEVSLLNYLKKLSQKRLIGFVIANPSLRGTKQSHV